MELRFYYYVKKYLKPIDIIGLTGLLAMVFLQVYYQVPFDYWDLVFILFLIIAPLCLLFIFFFYQSLIKLKRQRTKNHFIIAGQKTKFLARKLIPFFIYISIYNQIHNLTRRINDCNFDQFLINIDRWLLAGKDIAVLSQHLVFPQLSYWLAFCYGLYFFFFLVTPVALFFMGYYRELDNLLLAVVIVIYLGLLGYILVPCTGPILAQQSLFLKPLWPLNSWGQEGYLAIINGYAKHKDFFHCFPSLHIAASFVFFVLY